MYLYSLAYKYCSGLLNADTATSPYYCAQSQTREKMRLIVRLFEVYVWSELGVQTEEQF